MTSKIKQGWQRIQHFLREDVWELDIYTLSGLRRQGVRLLRIVQLVIRGYREDRLSLHASALTFATLMSLVPALAVSFLIFKGMGKQDEILAQLNEKIQGFPADFQGFVQDNILGALANLDYAQLGGLGALLLLFTVIKVLGSIESSFNTIWGVSRSRPLLRKFTDYISTMVIVPFLIVASSTFTSSGFVEKLGAVGSLYEKSLKLSGLFIAWLAFSFLFRFMPNARVKAGPSLAGGLVAAILAIGWQKIYIMFQVGVVKNNVIFGTFATVPIFLAWVYMTWVIVLFGAEVSFAVQNHSTFVKEQRAREASVLSRIRLALDILQQAGNAALNEGKRFDIQGYAEHHRVPVRLLQEMSGVLCEAGLLAPVEADGDSYVLARAAERIPLSEVIKLLLERGADAKALGLGHLDVKIDDALEQMELGLDKKLEESSLSDILRA